MLTEPEMGPSCADFPLTLKVTPLGAFDLTSRLAVKRVSYSFNTLTEELADLQWCGRSLCLGAVTVFEISKAERRMLSAQCHFDSEPTSLAGLPISLKATGTAAIDIVTNGYEFGKRSSGSWRQLVEL